MKPESEYLFVEVAAQRCLQLMRGARPKIASGARKYTTLAITEVNEGVVPWSIDAALRAELVAAGTDEAAEGEAQADGGE
jgi:DNA-directed RNA polymerase subunit K/omega